MNQHHAKLAVPLIIIVIAIVGTFLSLSYNKSVPAGPMPVVINSFEECAAAGNAVMESYPRQCAAGGRTFTEVIPGVTDMDDQIRVSSPVANSNISSPLTITGQARGSWFFEANAPVVLTNWDGLIIAEGYVTAEGEWMTSDFVPFKGTLTFTKPSFNNRGFLILQKSNASGLSENDAAIEIPIYFEGVAPQGVTTPPEQVACTMDAKMCPDGKYVGRQGPKCEFAPCPGN